MSILAQILLVILVGLFLIYLGVELRALKKNPRPEPGKLSAPPGSCPDGFVSVLLPVYNEKLVVEKLINSVAALEYDRSKLEILVLDDSTDETSSMIARLTGQYQKKGVPIIHLRRDTRIGYKAGNLNFGLGKAKGDFIAIFDADCLPPADFLLKLMPSFNNPEVGFLQTPIAYSNAKASILTRFQAAEASHKEAVTGGLSQDGFMASLTGSSCIWRRACINSIGGISQETITEDVDMGYAAQLRNWRYLFPQDVVSWAELPELMAAFRVQRQRWARGLVHNAARHYREVLGAPMGFLAKIHAVSLVFSPLLLALFYALLLISPLVSLVTKDLGLLFNIVCLIFLAAAIVWGWTNTSGQESGKSGLLARIPGVVGYVLLFFPLSLYYFSAIFQTLLFGKGKFYTTPKGAGRGRIKHPPINCFLLGLEIFSFFYALFSLVYSVVMQNYWVTLYTLLALGGFTMTLFFSWSDSRKKAAPPRSILITGASGAIGSALAETYAAPGIRLILQGRKKCQLEHTASICEARGASVSIAIIDLSHTAQTREWAREMAQAELPDLIILNAGVNTNIGPSAQGEPFEESLKCVQVNLLANMAIVDAMLPGMRQRKSGQIAIMSSLAAYYGLVHTPAYCATKAALKNWGASLRGWLAPEGIRVSVIFPGYVKSAMCDAMPGPKPFMWTPKKAATKIRRGLAHDKARISFPFPLNLGIWALNALPLFLAMPIAKFLGYGR